MDNRKYCRAAYEKVGNNVFSLLGFRITEIPVFRPSNGVKVSFNARLADGRLSERVFGTKTVFGLVMHRVITFPGEGPRWRKWTISEPTTGGAVAHGGTRQDVLDDLALRIAFYGGEEEFSTLLRDAVTKQNEDTVTAEYQRQAGQER